MPRQNLPRGKVRAIVVNAGNANAFTGKLGDKAVEGEHTGRRPALGCPRNEVFMASTGVIGQPLAGRTPPSCRRWQSAREDGWSGRRRAS